SGPTHSSPEVISPAIGHQQRGMQRLLLQADRTKSMAEVDRQQLLQWEAGTLRTARGVGSRPEAGGVPAWYFSQHDKSSPQPRGEAVLDRLHSLPQLAHSPSRSTTSPSTSWYDTRS